LGSQKESGWSLKTSRNKFMNSAEGGNRTRTPRRIQDFLTSYGFRRAPKDLWSGLYLRLLLFVSSQAGAVKSLHFSENYFSDLARYCQIKGFTEFDSIHTEDFASDAQTSKSCASTYSATPALEKD
jgi:hypothetical protein